MENKTNKVKKLLASQKSSQFSPKFFETESPMGRLQKIIHIITSVIEVLLSAVLVAGILVSTKFIPGYFREVVHTGLPGLRSLITYVSLIIIVIELIHVLNLQNLKSVIEILMIAFTRELVIKEWSMLELLIGVVCIAVLFAIEKFLLDNSEKAEDESDRG